MDCTRCGIELDPFFDEDELCAACADDCRDGADDCEDE